MNRGATSVIGLVLGAILAVAVIVFANNALYAARLDLTENRLFTLSEGSLNVLRSVDEPVTLRFYFSSTLARQIPNINTYGQRVRELLEQYASISGGAVRLEVINPEPFTVAEDEAVRAGLQAVPVSQTENLYFGLVGTNMVDDQEVIPFFQQSKEQFLEYDLTRLVYSLSNPERPVVGLITGHQMNANVSPLLALQGNAPQPWAIVEQIRDNFELRTIDPSENAIPEDVDILLMVHPPELSDRMLYAIDQYVLSGGRALVYADPFSELAVALRGQAARSPTGPAPESSNLPKLFDAWGITMEEGKFVGDWRAAEEVNAGMRGSTKIVRYLPWLRMDAANYDGRDVVMGDLGPVVTASAGSLVAREDATTSFVPLITTSTEAMLFDTATLRAGPNPEGLIELFQPADKSFVLAARITGPAKSAFPDGPPPVEEAADGAAADEPATEAAAGQSGNEGDAEDAAGAAPAHLSESEAPINVIVVADSDLLYDQFWLRTQDFFGQRVTIPVAANADMLVNALDNLSGSNDLITLRSRGKSSRPFEVVERLRREAEQRFLDEEQRLMQQLEASQQRISELESQAPAGDGDLLSDAQQAEIDKAREGVLKTRQQLRAVQRNLNRDIELLATQLKFANIGLIPIVIALVAVGLAVARHQRRRRRAGAARS